MTWLKRLAAPLVAAIVAGAIVGAIAYASIPDPSGVIHGCYKTAAPHTLVVIDSASQTCNATQTPINWNQTGPRGQTGPAGPSDSYSAKPATKRINAKGLTVVGTLKIPAGDFEVFAKGDISSSDVADGSGLDGFCELITGPLTDQIFFNTAALPGLLPEVPVVMQAPLPAAANNGTVTVSCESSGTTPSASHVVITAIKVGSLSVS